MLGSLDVVADIKAIAAPCERAVWMDCYDQGMTGYKYSFLNESDINLMNAAGMMIPTYDKQLQAEAVSKHLAYSYISKELVVLTPEKVECRKSYPQQIPHWDGKVEDMTDWTPDGKEIAAVEANTQKVIHRVSSTIFNGLDTPKDEGGIGRNYESFSSLDMLIQNPFDYVLQYVFKCNETSRTNLSLFSCRSNRTIFSGRTCGTCRTDFSLNSLRAGRALNSTRNSATRTTLIIL